MTYFLTVTKADYLCICNYNVEEAVLKEPDPGSTAIGYLYEFDCKALYGPEDKMATIIPIMFEKKVNICIFLPSLFTFMKSLGSKCRIVGMHKQRNVT